MARALTRVCFVSNSYLPLLRTCVCNIDRQLLSRNGAKSFGSTVALLDNIPTSKHERQFALTFEEYQKSKRSLRTKQRLAGIPFAFAGMGLSSIACAYMFPDMFDATPDNVTLILGIDPLVFCGICGVCACGAGYVLGTNFYKLLWSFVNKERYGHLQKRDSDFLARLEKRRFQSDSKFEDDYYGESIRTLSDYRQWVRTQQRKAENAAKFNREKRKNEATT